MIFTSEQVSAGHPDKICDQISDAILTECLLQDKKSKVAIETLIKNCDVIIAGELTTTANVNFEAIIKRILSKTIYGNVDDFKIHNYISEQSPDISQGVDTGGAGDQGMMFGYATNETKECLPKPYVLATKALTKLRTLKNDLLRPDAKSQVTFDYSKNQIDTFLISVQHSEKATQKDLESVLYPIMNEVAEEMGLSLNFKRLINPTGRFVRGGPFADCGVTGRKIIADTYGSSAKHGGGAFSGKDPTKVDRSGAYMARHIAKQIIKNSWADRCEIQLAYAIGISEPVSVNVDCFNTEQTSLEIIERIIRQTYDLTPQGIIKYLDLLNVDYNRVSAYGHFTNPDLPWEEVKVK